MKTMLSYDLKIIFKILAFTLIWETSGEFQATETESDFRFKRITLSAAHYSIV